MKDRSKNEISFETFLLDSVKNDKVDIIKLEKINISDREQKKADDIIQRSINRRTIKNISSKTDKNKTLSSFIVSVREKASFDITTIARLLNLDGEIYSSIEKSTIQIAELDTKIVTNLLITFRIKLDEFIEMIRKEVLINQKQPSQVRAIARTSHRAGSEERENNIKLGIDAVMLELAKMKNNESGKVSINIDKYSNLINTVRASLIKNEETDLLV